MPVPQPFQEFEADKLKGVHDFSTHTIMVALCNAANAPDLAADSVLADITQIAYTNLPARTLTVDSVTQTAGLATVIIDDFALVASGGPVGPFRYIVVYNDSATDDPLIARVDIGVEITIEDTQQVLLDFNGVSGFHQSGPAA